MLFRLLIFAILGVVLYRVCRSWLKGSGWLQDEGRAQPPGQVDDIMIKDPVCGAYFPKRHAIVLKQGDKDFHFCSTECRDRYAAQQEQPPSH